MRKYLLFIVAALCINAAAEQNDNVIIADEKNADLYDTPYSLNPVPIQPNTPQPTSWKIAYDRLEQQQISLQQQLNTLRQEVQELKDKQALIKPAG